MEDLRDEAPDYRRGFNNAYLLANYEPDLLSQIIPSLQPSNQYFSGFFAGKGQWEIEQSRSVQIAQESNYSERQTESLDQEWERKQFEELNNLRDQESEREQDLNLD